MNREHWVRHATRLARPVLEAAAEGRLEEALAAMAREALAIGSDPEHAA